MNAARQQPLAFWKTVVTSFLLMPSAAKKVFPFAIMMSLLNYITEIIINYKPEATVGVGHLITYIAWTVFVSLIGITFFTATLCRVNSIFRGADISLRDAILRGVRKLLDQCVISLVLFGSLALMLLPCYMIIVFALHRDWAVLAFFMEGIFTMIIIGFFYFLVRFAFTSTMMALKDFTNELSLKLRVKTCFLESYHLVKGYWWRTFGVLVIVIASSAVPILLLGKLMEKFGEGLWMTLIFMIVKIAIFPLFSTFILVLFYDLQTRRLKHI